MKKPSTQFLISIFIRFAYSASFLIQEFLNAGGKKIRKNEIPWNLPNDFRRVRGLRSQESLR